MFKNHVTALNCIESKVWSSRFQWRTSEVPKRIFTSKWISTGSLATGYQSHLILIMLSNKDPKTSLDRNGRLILKNSSKGQLLKSLFWCKKYLGILSSKFWKVFVFRTSNHRLSVKTGRWLGIPWMRDAVPYVILIK